VRVVFIDISSSLRAGIILSKPSGARSCNHTLSDPSPPGELAKSMWLAIAWACQDEIGSAQVVQSSSLIGSKNDLRSTVATVVQNLAQLRKVALYSLSFRLRFALLELLCRYTRRVQNFGESRRRVTASNLYTSQLPQ
jgi:hypothetical protein